MKFVSQYMTSDLVHIGCESTILEAVYLMREKGIGAVLVDDENNEPAGIFTERDLLNKVDFSDPAKLHSLQLKDFMSKNLITVEDQEVYTIAIELMRQYNIRHMPVVREEKIVGMVSLRDLVRHYEENLQHLVQEKENKLLENIGKIKQSEERFRTIFNNSAVAITFADKNERIVQWNPLTLELLGMEVEDIRNKPVSEFYTDEEWKRLRSLNIRQLGQAHHLETFVKHKNGDFIDIELSVSVLKDEKDQVVGSIGIMRDIRKRKETEVKLAESRRELENIKYGLDQHAIVAITDNKGVITYANDRFCEVTKYSREELLGKDHRILNSGYHTKKFIKELWDTITAGKVWRGEFKNKRKDGTYYWVDTTIVPLVDEHGEPQQYVSIRNDISKRKKYEEELEMTNKDLSADAKSLRQIAMDKETAFKRLKENQKQIIQLEKMATLGTLAAGFAHEIKNPLAIILQGMERIEKIISKLGDENNQQYINIIKSAAERANKIVTSILRYSRSSQLDVGTVNIYEVIDSAIELVNNNARLNKIDFLKNYKVGDYYIEGDTIMLQQVFFDLFTNAIHAMPEGGSISIDVAFGSEKKKKNFKILIKDTGEGIEKDHLTRIFEPFFTTKDEGKGTGLGLSTVFMILQRHNGTIKVESKKGDGTTFIITLPIGGATEIERNVQHVG